MRSAAFALLALPLTLAGGCSTDAAARRLIADTRASAGLPPTVVVEEPVTRTHRAYHENGELRRRWTVLHFPDGHAVKHGADTSWHADGSLATQRFYRDGEPAGEWRSFHDDGTPAFEVNFAVGKTSPMRFWHANGVLAAQGPQLDGIREGAWSFWYEDGALEEEGRYVAGQRHGPWRAWHADGSLRASGEYRQGERVGEWELYGEQP